MEKNIYLLKNDLNGKSLSVEVKFLSINENFTNQIETILKKHSIAYAEN